MEKSNQVKVFFENRFFDYCIVTNLEDADLMVKEDGTIARVEVPKLVVPPTYNLEAEVSNLLINFGIPVNIKGYRFTLEAIMIAIDNPKSTSAVTKILYPAIAQRFNTLPSRAERAIRHGIEVAWVRGNPELHNKFFVYSEDSKRKRPTNSEFICGIAEHFKMQLKNATK